MIKFYPNISEQDQHHAEALESLRKSEHYLICTERKGIEGVEVFLSGDPPFIVRAVVALYEAMEGIMEKFVSESEEIAVDEEGENA